MDGHRFFEVQMSMSPVSTGMMSNPVTLTCAPSGRWGGEA